MAPPRNPGIGIEYALGGLNYGGRNNYGRRTAKYLFVPPPLLSPPRATVLCVQCSLGCTLQDIQSEVVSGEGLGRVGWGSAGGRSPGIGSAGDCCYCVIVQAAISVLKIMSPSNEVRLLLLFIISCRPRCRRMPPRCCVFFFFKKRPL